MAVDDSGPAVVSPPALPVARVQRFCVGDGPGIRTTVFTRGCPLHCWWCHNPHLRAPAAGGWVAVGDLVRLVERDARYWRASGGGVTVSGGECLVHARPLQAFLAELGRRGHDRCVDTAGAAPLEDLARVAPETDRWLYDLKAITPALFARAVGGDARRPVANLRWLLAHTTTPVTVRVPLIAGFNARVDELERLAAVLADLPRPVAVEILPGHRLGTRGEALPTNPEPTGEQIDDALRVLGRSGMEAQVAW